MLRKPHRERDTVTTILMIIAPENFRDEEYFEPKQLFEQAGFAVTTASTRAGKIKGSQGGVATADFGIQMIDPKDYEAVVLVGGSGAREFFENEKLHSLLQEFYEGGKLTTAICVSPNTLANAGLLEGKQATIWKEEELIANLQAKGGNYTGLAVTIDGNIVTANGPQAAKEFAQEIIELLKEDQHAQHE